MRGVRSRRASLPASSGLIVIADHIGCQERGGDRRQAERLGIALSPLFNLALHGRYRRYRAIDASEVARAALALARKSTRAKLVHEHDALRREARSLPMPDATGTKND